MTCRESFLQFSQESLVFQFSNDIKTEINRTVILAAVLCELGTWCLILSEKFWHSMFESRVLSELHNFYSTSDIILVMTSGRRTYLSHVAMQGAEEKYIKVLV
jgi:hypothetical protein